MNLIYKLPYPIAGLMLGLAALGNLLGGYNMMVKNVFGITSACIGLLLLIKMILLPASLKNAFENPVVGSVMAAFPMAIMLLSTYLKPLIPSVAFGLWIAGIIIHVVFMIIFTNKYIINFNIKKVFPSYFVMYVGIICASVSSPAFGMQALGRLIFWFGLACYVVLLPIVIYRVIKIKNIPLPASPTLVIFAAPASLCLTGYMNAFETKSPILVYTLGILAILMATYGIVKMIGMLKLKFMPSYSAFTFPIVISAIATGAFNKFLGGNSLVSSLQIIFTVTAVTMVIYVLLRYLMFLLTTQTEEKKVTAV